MITTISKGQLFTVTTAVDDERLKAFKKAPELLQAGLEVGAEYWHTGILPKHFESGGHMKYGYAERALSYARQHAGKPSLVFSGSLRNDVKAHSSIWAQSGARSVAVKMFARVLNFAPTMPENSPDFYVKHRNTKYKGYPNLKREIKLTLDVEREAIAVVVAQNLERAFDPSNTGTAE